MSLRTSANRYAKALFDVALQEKADLDQVDRDLAGRRRDDAGEPGTGRGVQARHGHGAARKSLMEAVRRR